MISYCLDDVVESLAPAVGKFYTRWYIYVYITKNVLVYGSHYSQILKNEKAKISYNILKTSLNLYFLLKTS